MTEQKKNIQSELQTVFMNYCLFGDKSNTGTMTSAKFAKLCQETGLIDKHGCTKTDVDLIFTKVKPKSGRTITYTLFLQALGEVAAKKFAKEYKSDAQAAVDKVVAKVTSHEVPSSSGTVPDSVKFYDDKSTFTGTALHGGPTINDKSISLSSLTDRT
eukprot:TRINITY_DN9313_c0_g1_i1.p1 TRINITY_DN9313_c0_g1~~TRINITY_DN9313_c0_g1_i1.p1  ORF type:complete len:158 (-),score=44.01 TRINITY_DN9313_c0_g1_i1:264-737(-)